MLTGMWLAGWLAVPLQVHNWRGEMARVRLMQEAEERHQQECTFNPQLVAKRHPGTHRMAAWPVREGGSRGASVHHPDTVVVVVMVPGRMWTCVGLRMRS